MELLMLNRVIVYKNKTVMNNDNLFLYVCKWMNDDNMILSENILIDPNEFNRPDDSKFDINELINHKKQVFDISNDIIVEEEEV